MPTISLRLTDAEHEALKTWAHDSHRSIQKEAIWRLFSLAHEQAEKSISETAQSRAASGLVLPKADSTDQHFKPDFK